MRGGQRQTALVLAGLAARGHEVRLLGPARLAPGCGRANAGLDVVEVPPGSEASPALLLAVAREARSFRPEIVYAGDARGHGAAVFSRAAAAAPLVVHRRVVFPPGRDPLSRLKYRAAARLPRRLARRRGVPRTGGRPGGEGRRRSRRPSGRGLPREHRARAASFPARACGRVRRAEGAGRRRRDPRAARRGRARRDRALPRRRPEASRRRGAGRRARRRRSGARSRATSRTSRRDSPRPTSCSSRPTARAGLSSLVEAMAAGCLAVGHDVGGASRDGRREGRPGSSSRPSTRRRGRRRCSPSSSTPHAARASSLPAARRRASARSRGPSRGVEAELEKARAGRGT